MNGSKTKTTRALVLAVVLSAPLGVHAGGVNIMAFQPSAFSGDILSVARSGVGTSGRFSVGLNVHFTKSPLAIEGTEFKQTLLEETVGSRLMTELLVSFAPIEWLDLGLAMPFVLTGDGKPAGAGFSDLGDPSGFALGELRFSIRGVFIRNGPVRFGLQVDTTFPTGDPEKLSTNGFGAAPRLLLDVRAGIFSAALNVGAYLRQEGTIAARGGAPVYLTVSHELLAGLGGGLQVIDQLEIVGEIYMRTQLTAPFEGNSTQLEAMGGLRWTPIAEIAVSAGGGGGTPIVQGYGTSQFRFFVGFRYSPQPGQDRDGDGIDDGDDKCPVLPEDRDGFEDTDGCPDPDNDGDGILDVDDGCPNEAEDKDNYDDADGCPENDNDGDRIPDNEDKCPNDLEDFDQFEDDDGCPDPDNDKDGIDDIKDQCPNATETFNDFEDTDGCPDFPGVSVRGNRIVLTDPIRFAKNKSGLPASAYAGLRNLARLVKANPQWKKIEIVVHTGQRGRPQKLEKLTERRADQLQQFLITEGINYRRLRFSGRGASAGVGDKVEFLITK